MPRSTVIHGSGACSGRVLVALSLLSVAIGGTGCGRLGFETASDGGLDAADGEASDADVADVGLRDAFVRDVGVDASVDAGCAPALDPCLEIRRLGSAPTIDGVRETCVPLVPIAPVGWTSPAPMPSIAMRAAIAWRPDGLYVFIEVDDPDRFPAVASEATYCGDGIELYVDQDGTFAVVGEYDAPGTVQLIVTAPETETASSSRGERFVDGALSSVWPSARFVVVGTPTGYALETLVSAEELGLPSWSLTAGQRVGLDLSVNVSTSDGSSAMGPRNCGARLGQFFSRVVAADPPMLCGQPFCDTRAFCTPILR